MEQRTRTEQRLGSARPDDGPGSHAVPTAERGAGPAERPRPAAARSAHRGRGEQVRGEHVHGDGDYAEQVDGGAADAPPARTRRVPQRHSVRGQVLAALRRSLAAGELAPGRVHSAPVLAEKYGVSPTPVREAMQQLASEGLVETVPNRGFRVVAHSDRDTAEFAEVRLLLELPVLLRLCRSRPPTTWEALRPLADRTVSAAARGDRGGYAEADRDFHRALLEPAGNSRLIEIADDVHRRAHLPVPAAPGLPTPGLVSGAAEHAALLDALLARDAAAVERVLRAHLAPPPGRGTVR